jgi:hypothetical protein
MPVPYSDVEIDAAMLKYQQRWCEHHTDMKVEAICRLIQQDLLAEHPRFGNVQENTIKSALSKFGGTNWYLNATLKGLDEWVATGFTQKVFKAMHAAWANSIVRQPDGSYRVGATDDVNAALVRAVEALGHKTDAEQMFYWRCRFGWATTAEIRAAGFIPGSRLNGVLQRQPEACLFSDYVGDDEETVESRLDRHDEELRLLREAVASIEHKIAGVDLEMAG